MELLYQRKIRGATGAKKGLGQNFLADKNKIKEIISALEPKDGDTIIEIGPGHGELTKELMTNNKKLRIIAIEKDGVLAEKLRNSMEMHGNKIEIITGDALKILPVLISDYELRVKSYKLLGNIPYYITGFLLRTLSELEFKPRKIVLTIQKEVAERIIAQPPQMNLLAASVQFWAEPEILGIIPKKYFLPQPRVDSAILALTPKKTSVNQENYYPFIRSLFKQPRKTISNNLLSVFKDRQIIEHELKKIGVKPDDRPQNLAVPQIERLAKATASRKCPKTVKKSALI